MDAANRRFLCTALGFTVMLLRGETIPDGERAARALGIAGLIEAFCREAGDAAVVDRMAVAIAGISRQQGGCLPPDVIARGFTPDEVSRYWQYAKALAAVALET